MRRKKHYNQSELVGYLKRQGRYMSATEIAKQLGATHQTINRKLNKLTPRIIEKKPKQVSYGSHERKIWFYRFKRKK